MSCSPLTWYGERVFTDEEADGCRCDVHEHHGDCVTDPEECGR